MHMCVCMYLVNLASDHVNNTGGDDRDVYACVSIGLCICVHTCIGSTLTAAHLDTERRVTG